jgi:uncharacterized repeat protein (TIGR03803 family)
MKRMVDALGKLNWGKRAYAVLVLCATTAIALPAQTFTTLHSFNGTDGQNPYATPVQATNGDFYGTTQEGAANCDAYGFGNGCGTVFKMTPSGTLTPYDFDGADGAIVYAGLVQATNGDLYGTVQLAGGGGGGTVFKITLGGTLTTLYRFPWSCSTSPCTAPDGALPFTGLVQATNGDLYGTTEYGSSRNCSPYGCGTVFKITPGGTLTTLYSFCTQSGCADGEYPQGVLVQATNGDFYGTTLSGGANGWGTVFKITPSGTLTTLYSFCSQSACTDGAFPQAGLVDATNGDFYGTTYYGGANGQGTVFKISPAGTLTTLYNFCSQSGCTDGQNPSAGLIQATDGDFYGTTCGGSGSQFPCGTNGLGYGTVFKITPSGTLTTLYRFCSQSGCTDGSYPFAGLLQATNGNFYGTTVYGGANDTCSALQPLGCGTIFSLSVGLSPFVKTLPTSGKVGAAVKILGTDLTGAISVTFNGTPAAITFTSPTEIATTVPTGATTGKVEVTASGRTFSSNVPFRVLP